MAFSSSADHVHTSADPAVIGVPLPMVTDEGCPASPCTVSKLIPAFVKASLALSHWEYLVKGVGKIWKPQLVLSVFNTIRLFALKSVRAGLMDRESDSNKPGKLYFSPFGMYCR